MQQYLIMINNCWWQIKWRIMFPQTEEEICLQEHVFHLEFNCNLTEAVLLMMELASISTEATAHDCRTVPLSSCP